MLRTDGLYLAKRLWVRAFPDGRVHAASLEPEISPEQAAQRLHPGMPGVGMGEAELNADSVRLVIQFPGRERIYEGTGTPDELSLWWIKQGKRQSELKFVFYPLTEAAFEPPLAARAHELRSRIAAHTIEVEHVEAAAAAGDPVATLALRSVFAIDEISQRFARLGTAACLRLLLALAFSDDGGWYRPTQSISKDGSKKCEEGKVLRALARWCVKPTEKLMADAESNFSDVVRVGPPYHFMAATMRVAMADNDADRAAALKEALELHVSEDALAAAEVVQNKVVPWLLGLGDPLAEALKNIK